MKARLTLLILAAACTANAQDSAAWVRQTDLTNGIVYDIPLPADGGSFQAPLPISEMGSTFHLYARGTAWDTKIYLLDTKLIRAYAPAVTVNLTSEDSYVRGDPASSNYVRRTRADRPFNLGFNIGGLAPGSSSQAERSVYFASYKSEYHPATFSALNQNENLLTESEFGNGNFTLGPLYQQLNTGTPTNACGEHSFTFVRYASDGVPDTTLVQAKVEIWPIAKATVENLSSGQVFNDRITTVMLHLKNLYPDSRTFAQVYPGPAVLGTVGTEIKGTERRYGLYYNPQSPPTNVPQNQDIAIDDLSNYTPTDGIYTVEVITQTPFFNRAPERLLSVTFEVDRVISSYGQFSTAEK